MSSFSRFRSGHLWVASCPGWTGKGKQIAVRMLRGFATKLLGSKGYILPKGRSGFALGSSCLCPA